jgi:predicted transcriptional regulator of viral defense system
MPVELLRRTGGTATFAQLRVKVSGRAIRTALASGSIRRIAKAVYALPPADDPRGAARAQGGVVSHLSAAILHGFDLLELPATAQVTVPRGQHRRASTIDCQLYRKDDAPSKDGTTTKLRTVLDCTRTSPFTEGLCVADSALRSTHALSHLTIVATRQRVNFCGWCSGSSRSTRTTPRNSPPSGNKPSAGSQRHPLRD